MKDKNIKIVKNKPFRWLMCPFMKARALEVYDSLNSRYQKVFFEMALCYVIGQGYHDKKDYKSRWQEREKWLTKQRLDEFKGQEY